MQIFTQGLERLMAAIEAAATDAFDRELDEIGSSDVSIACKDALGSLGIRMESISAEERNIVRKYMNVCICDIRARWN
jgi:hypothetical protein